MYESGKIIQTLYGTVVGRFLLKIAMKLRLDLLEVRFLHSPCSKHMIRWFVRVNRIETTPEEIASCSSFRDFFARQRSLPFDETPTHLISPCDGLLSTYPIDDHSCFYIKNSHYQVKDFLQDEDLAPKYTGGTCMIFRLCVSDYHHYCFIDDGFQGVNHPIPGELHSVHPSACERFPVYVRNKRSWCLMETEHFGPVVQCEIGALIVGGICNDKENETFKKGSEKGHFELAGSTIVLLFEPGKVTLRPELTEQLAAVEEIRVSQGEWIGTSTTN